MARKFWVIDAETDPFKFGRVPKPFLWGAYDGNEYETFKTGKELVEFFYDKPVVIYAHNGGKFDYHFLTEYLEPDENIKIINGRLASFRIGSAEYRDSYSILPIPLSAYKKDAVDYHIFEEKTRDTRKNKEIIEKYLKADCVYLYELIAAFKETYGNGLTLPGAALSFWSKFTGIKRPHTSKHFFDEIRPYYAGGRCEAIRPGIHKGNFRLYDINSAYPYAMSHDHPWGDRYKVSKRLPKRRGDLERCFITLTCAAVGALAKRDEKTRELSFPTHQRQTTFNITGWEFLAARETKTLGAYTIHKVISFYDCVNFKGYVDHFFDIKKKSAKGSPAYIFSKLFMNSLYGKLAANPDKYRDYKTCDPSEIKLNLDYGWSLASLIGKVAILEKPVPEKYRRYLNVATGASITGFVRAMLWRAICAAKNPIYCDTDSIACTSAQLPESQELGQWSVEFAFNNAAVAAKKLYAFWDTETGAEKLAHKGVKLNRGEIVTICKGEEITYNRDAPTFGIKPKKSLFVTRKVRMKKHA